MTESEGHPAENTDPAELAKFEALGAHWWDRQGELKALHDINPLRIGYIEARTPLSGVRVLDVGSGGGIMAEAMARKGAAVTGIDAGKGAVGAARAHAEKSGLSIDYVRTTVESFAQTGRRRFDIVTCMELLEHVPEPEAVVGACSRLVKDGGDVFFATLNRNLKSFLFAIVGAEYLLNLVRRGTHTYRRFIKPAELKSWGEKHGLAWMDSTGLHYNPFSKRYHLGGNLHVNYLMHLKKI